MSTLTLPPASEVPRSGEEPSRDLGPLAHAAGSADDRPLVSVVVPVRDEAGHLGRSLRAIVAQDLPAHLMEVIVVDGASADTSIEVAEAELSQADGLAHQVVTNPVATTPSNLNAGLAAARGDYVCRVDARSFIPSDYVRRCVAILAESPTIAVVGGAQVAEPRSFRAVDRAIALALNNPYGMGGSRYRSGATSGTADTVYLGVFRREQLEAVGGWDERLATNQDFDLNRRLGRFGAVWYEDGLPVAYAPRPSVRQLVAQYHRFGRWKVRYWRLTGDRPRPRQVALLTAPLAALIALPAVGGLLRRAPVAGRVGVAAAIGVAATAVARAAELEDEPSATERGLALVALGMVSAAWTTGVWREAVRGR